MKSRALLLLFFLLLLSIPPASAQSTGTIQGLITDAQSAVLPGVTVTVGNTTTGVSRAVVTDPEGRYFAPSLPPGPYKVSAQLQGFKTQSTDVDLAVAVTLTANFQLAVGNVSEQVQVNATSPIIESNTVSVGTVINQRTVQEIPLNGRHFVDLGLLIPGSVTPPQNGFLTAPLRGQGSFAFNTAGNREDTVNFMINGVNLNDMAQNQITFQPSINTVSGVQGRQLDVQRRIRPQLRRHRQHRDALGHQRPARRGLRVLQKRLARLPQLLQSAAGAAVAVQAQPVRRLDGRADHQEPHVLLRQLRGPAAAPGARHQQRRAARRPARGCDRSGVPEPAAVHSPGQRVGRAR